jgi:hypothetical protein
MTMSDTFEEAAGVSLGTTAEAEGVDTEEGEGIVVDLGGVNEAGNFVAMPRGLYDVTVAQLDYGKSQRSNNPMWTWIFEIDGGEYNGRKLFYHTVFNEGGLPRVKRTLARIQTDDGYPQQLLTQRFNPQVVADEGRLLGARAKVRLDIRTYQGKKQNDIKDVLPPGTASGAAGASGAFAGV